jgi:hypothetical protein
MEQKKALRQNYENVIIDDYVTDSLRIPIVEHSWASIATRPRSTSRQRIERGRKEKTFPPSSDNRLFLDASIKFFYEIFSPSFPRTRQRRRVRGGLRVGIES